jgi:protocatechuate 3,4-dioxygenase beta subunit
MPTSSLPPSVSASSASHLILALSFLLIAISAFPASAERRQQEQRTPLIVSGKVLDDQNNPLPNALVQIWQTHPISGLYNHPSSATPEQIDPTFQYFGTATAEEDGTYEFITYKPAPFSYRAPHIHFKVWLPSNERDDEGNDSRSNVLTSQFYFREDGTRADERLLLDLEEVSDVNGNAALRTNKNIVIGGSNGNTGGNVVTPSQTEGPFYPVENFFELGGNLIKTADDVPEEEDELVDIDDEEEVEEDGVVDIATAPGDADKSASSLQEATSPSSSAVFASIFVPALFMLLSIFSNLIH